MTPDARAVGRVVALARRAARRAPMVETPVGRLTVEAGMDGDCKGARFPKRQITVLALEDWAVAVAEIDALDLSWLVRRANVLVRDVRLPRAAGAVLSLGPVALEVTGQTNPCRRMDEAAPGLLKALHPNWRGGVTCRVLNAGIVAAGDPVEIVHAPEERRRRLP